ncbi:uncharacterized protein LOC119958245 isoform X2 [Scyliorhinus canicula]|nr:uncharacterized protein LOC119958245 isoform X2 [Scyliorhinus canicula]
MPPLASVRMEREVNSRRQNEPIPNILQDSTNRGDPHYRNGQGDPRAHRCQAGMSSKVATGKDVNAPKYVGHWDRGGLEDLEIWESKEKRDMCYMRPQEAWESSMNLRRGWNSPEQFKRPLGHQQKQARRPLPLLYEPIDEEWEPLYIRDLPQSPPLNQPADSRQAEVYPFSKEHWTRDHWPHREAANLSDYTQLGPQTEPSERRILPSPSSFEGKGYKERPLKPPSYEMYLQMKVRADQERKIAQLENYQRNMQKSPAPVHKTTSFPGHYEMPQYMCQQALGGERKPQGGYGVFGSNVKTAFPARNPDSFDGERDRIYPPASELGFKSPQDGFANVTADRPNCSQVSRNEKMGQVHQKRKCIDPERYGALVTERDPGTSYGGWRTMDAYLSPGVTQRPGDVSFPLYHTSGKSGKEKQKRSDLKHGGMKAPNPHIESDGWLQDEDIENQAMNRMKGDVLRSKRGEVVFCLISRPDSSQKAQDPRSHTLPKVGRKSDVPSWPDGLESPLLTQRERRFSELQGSNSANMEAGRPPDCVEAHAYPSKQEFHPDTMKFRSANHDIETHGWRNLNYTSNSDHHFSAGNTQAPGERTRQQLAPGDGEGMTRWRDPENAMRKERFDQRSAEWSVSGLQVAAQEGAQWDRGCRRKEMGLMSPSNRCGPDGIGHDRIVSALEWKVLGKPRSVKRQAWDVSLDGEQQHFGSKRLTVANQQRERKLPEWKEPLRSSVRTANRFNREGVTRGPAHDGVFIIDASTAIVKVEYIPSPKKERVRFSSPIEVEGFTASLEQDTLPDSRKAIDWSATGDVSERVRGIAQGMAPLREITGSQSNSRDSESTKRDLETKEDPIPPPKVKESMEKRASRILGLPNVDTDSMELLVETGPVPEETHSEVAGELPTEKRPGQWIADRVDGFESKIGCDGLKDPEPATIGTLQPLGVAPDLLDEARFNGETGDKTPIPEESQTQQEISQDETSWAPVEPGPSAENEEDLEHPGLWKDGEQEAEPAAQDLHDMVFESLSRIRRHTAPDSESDGEEVGQPLTPDKSEEGEVLSPSSGGSSASSDTVIMCSQAGQSEEALDTMDGESDVSAPEQEGKAASPQENTDDQKVQQLVDTDSRTHQHQEVEAEEFYMRETLLKELSEDQGESLPGDGSATSTNLVEPSSGAGSPECAQMVLGTDNASNSDTEIDGSDSAGESDAKCTGEVGIEEMEIRCSISNKCCNKGGVKTLQM